MSNPYPQSHYYPNSQVSVEEMDALYTVLDDEQAAIVAHAKLVGKQRTYRMPVGQHPADVAALLDAAKASLTTSRMERVNQLAGLSWSSFQIAATYSSGGNCEMWREQGAAYGFAAIELSHQVVAHL